MNIKNEIKKAYEKASYREKFAIENGTAFERLYGNENCISFEYSQMEEYQDANGATWSIDKQGWIG